MSTAVSTNVRRLMVYVDGYGTFGPYGEPEISDLLIELGHKFRNAVTVFYE